MQRSLVIGSAALSFGSFASYTLMDVGIQHLLHKSLNLFYVMFLNNLFSLVFMLLFISGVRLLGHRHRAPKQAAGAWGDFLNLWKVWRPRRWILHIILAMIALVGDVLVFYSFLHHSLAEVYTIILTTPLFATLFARFFYKETLTFWKGSCIFVGFAASFWTLNPSYSGISWALVGVLSTAIFYAIWYQIVKYHAREEGVAALFLSSRSILFVCLAIPAYLTAIPLTWQQLFINVGNGFGYFIGYVFIILATRWGNISTISAIHYIQLPLGILADIILYTIYPGVVSIGAGFLIVVSGLILINIDRRAELKQFRANYIPDIS